MDKRKFLKVVLSGSAGMLSLNGYSNAVSPLLSSKKNISTFQNNLSENVYSPVLNKVELKTYFNELNTLNHSLVEEANTSVFKPINARSILIDKNQYSLSLHKKASSFYNSKLFFRLITSTSNTELKVTSSVESVINLNYSNLDDLKQSLLNEALKCNEDFVWLTLNRHTLKLQISGGNNFNSPIQNSSNQLTVIAIDMRYAHFSTTFKNKQEYLEQLIPNLNWALFHKRIHRFIS